MKILKNRADKLGCSGFGCDSRNREAKCGTHSGRNRVEMEHFQNELRFSSWAGLVPECKKIASKKMSSQIWKGNRYLKACLVECARAGIRNKQSYFYSRCQRIAARRGGKRVLTAIAHSMLTAIYHMLKEKVRYCDLGADYYTVINQENLIKRNLRSLQKLGIDVIIQPK